MEDIKADASNIDAETAEALKRAIEREIKFAGDIDRERREREIKEKEEKVFVEEDISIEAVLDRCYGPGSSLSVCLSKSENRHRHRNMIQDCIQRAPTAEIQEFFIREIRRV